MFVRFKRTLQLWSSYTYRFYLARVSNTLEYDSKKPHSRMLEKSDLLPRYKRTVGIIHDHKQIRCTVSTRRSRFYSCIYTTYGNRKYRTTTAGNIDRNRCRDGVCRIVIGFDARDVDTRLRDVFTSCFLFQVEYKKTVSNPELC